jgi:hypothetical protein
MERLLSDRTFSFCWLPPVMPAKKTMQSHDFRNFNKELHNFSILSERIVPMGLFTQLGSFFRHVEGIPPVIANNFQPLGFAVEIGVDAALINLAEDQEATSDLEGSTFAIEYRDAAKNFSRRRVTVKHVYGSGEDRSIGCYCHERKAPRTFRYDRIVAVIDLDGVVHDPADFFANELRMPVERVWEERAPKATKPVKAETDEKPGVAHRKVARDGLRLLIALGRADGFLHNEELEVVLQYIASKTERAGLAMREQDCDALTGYLRRQHPSSDVLARCLDNLENESPADQKLFLRSAMALVNVDGIQHEAEFAMLLDLQQRLASASC